MLKIAVFIIPLSWYVKLIETMLILLTWLILRKCWKT